MLNYKIIFKLTSVLKRDNYTGISKEAINQNVITTKSHMTRLKLWNLNP